LAIIRSICSASSLPQAYIDPRYHKCYCIDCNTIRSTHGPSLPAAGPTLSSSSSGSSSSSSSAHESKHASVGGWIKLGVRVHDGRCDPTAPLNVWREWLKCYHGTGNKDVGRTRDILRSILEGSLLQPGWFMLFIGLPLFGVIGWKSYYTDDGDLNDIGDQTKDGIKLCPPPGHIPTTGGKWAFAVFTSPSLLYSSLPVYSPTIQLSGVRQNIQVVLQVRQMPKSYEVHDETVGGFSDTHISPTGTDVEWRTERRDCHIVTGVLVRFVPRV
jgi:hypothetical protein